MRKYEKIDECRAKALPRLNRLMEAIDPNYFWDIPTRTLKGHLIDKRNSSWNNDPTPAQTRAYECFKQEISLRMRDDFACEINGDLYMLDFESKRAEVWVMNGAEHPIRNIEEIWTWKCEEFDFMTVVDTISFFGLLGKVENKLMK